MSTPSQTPIEKLELPEPVSGADRLRLLYGHPGPYVSLFLATRPLLANAEADTFVRWTILRAQLANDGAAPKVLEAIDARLALPAPDEAAAIAVLVAADATTIVDYGQEPPRTDIATFDVLPYAAPLLEWNQRRVPHLVVTIDDSGADIVTFGPDRYTRMDSLDGPPSALSDAILSLTESTHARLIIVSGKPFVTRRLSTALAAIVPVDCRVVAEPDIDGVDELADVTVRHVSDTAARSTVGLLREMRFLAAHQSAVDGVGDTIDALRDRSADVLLIHDNPDDARRIWIGPEAHDLSLVARSDGDEHARLVDAVIRAAIVSETIVHIIPTTGPDGPDDNTAVLHR